jgi:hypothetical protein
MSIKKLIEVISPAKIPTTRVNREATREEFEYPRLTIPRETINARKVRPQAMIVNY